MSDFYSESTHRKAAKPHLCSTCFRTIDKGETYSHQTGNYDGRFYTFRMCAHCEAIWNIYRPENDEGMISEDGFDYWYQEGNASAQSYAHGKRWPDDQIIRELRHRAQFKMRWRTKLGTLVPVPASTTGSEQP